MVESRSEMSANAGEAIAALRHTPGARRVWRAHHGHRTSSECIAARGRGAADAALRPHRGLAPGSSPHPDMRPAHSCRHARRGNGGARLQRIRTHIPLINALASHSPFGSARTQAWRAANGDLSQLSTRSDGPQFDDFGHFCRVTRQVCAAGGLNDYTHIWWDARIQPGLGTIEIRAAD